MKKIGFIGAYDKSDFLIYLAKVLTVLNNRVLIVDSSLMQKAKYIVPTIQPTKSYITEFERIDVAVGFTSIDQLKGYLGLLATQELEYDVILLDIDSIETLDDFYTRENYMNFFATAFDSYSLKKGLEILSALKEQLPLTKLMFSKNMVREDEAYLNFLSQNYPVMWNNEKIYVLQAESDKDIIIENQRVAKIKFRNLSSGYKDGISHVVSAILPSVKQNEISKAYKIIDKGV